MIALNVRTPEKVIGDLQAQLAACRRAEREMAELFGRYGLEMVLAAGAQLQDYAEALTRAEIAEFPDGVYRFTDHIEGLGEDPEPVILQVAVTIAGDRILTDWTGSSPQVAGGINPSFPFSKSCVYTALRSVMSSSNPHCEGFTRPIRVIAPEGSILNPRFPGP